MAFTIHGLDKELEKKLTERARREGTSRNRLIKRLLARAMGMDTSLNEVDEYREFLGIWTNADLEAFEQTQEGNKRVDAGDWQ